MIYNSARLHVRWTKMSAQAGEQPGLWPLLFLYHCFHACAYTLSYYYVLYLSKIRLVYSPRKFMLLAFRSWIGHNQGNRPSLALTLA